MTNNNRPAVLPWSVQEVVDAVLVRFSPDDPDDVSTLRFAVCMEATAGLVLGRRAASHIEYDLFNRTLRVHQAICNRRDPSAAFDVPLDDEEPQPADFQARLEKTISNTPQADVIDHEIDLLMNRLRRKGMCLCCAGRAMMYRGTYLYADMAGDEKAVALCRTVADSIEDDAELPDIQH
jgi:hypothetical protein